MTLVTFAIPQESSGFRRAVRDSADAGEVLIAHTGIGLSAAQEAIMGLLAEHRPARVISAGFAGALDPMLAVGDLIIGENFSGPEWLAGLRLAAHRGRLHTSETPVATTAAKADLRYRTGAIAADMETSVIAEACASAGIPLLSLRAISDAADTSLPLPFSVSWDLRKQRPRPFAVAAYLALHPGKIRPLRRFIADLARARAGLAAGLGRVKTANERTGR